MQLLLLILTPGPCVARQTLLQNGDILYRYSLKNLIKVLYCTADYKNWLQHFSHQ